MNFVQRFKESDGTKQDYSGCYMTFKNGILVKRHGTVRSKCNEKEVMKCKDREMIIVEADDEIIEPDNVEDIFVSETDTALKILLEKNHEHDRSRKAD